MIILILVIVRSAERPLTGLRLPQVFGWEDPTLSETDGAVTIGPMTER